MLWVCPENWKAGIMRTSKIALSLACVGMLVSCGGGSSPTPTPTFGNGGGGGGGGGGTAGCSLDERLAFTDSVFNEWYLFPDLLDTSLNRSNFNNVQDYIDALVAPARAQGRDRFFSYVTSIREEEEFANSGATAGFGFRLRYDTPNRRVFVVETFEGTPALSADLDRGTEILGVGTSESNIVSVDSLIAAGGPQAVSEAFGPNTAGTTRVLDVRDQDGVRRTVTVRKADYSLDPISDRYGVQIIDQGTRQVGYLNLRTFSVESAEQQLIDAFAEFRAAGVTELVVDLRYNGGGFVFVAERFGDLLGRNLNGQIYSRIEYRPSKSERNSIYRFNERPQSIDPTKIAFITTGSSASASELVINGMLPWVDDIALVGADTFGKPVGQSAFDLAECDDRYRVVTLRIGNANSNFDYYDGLAGSVGTTCRAGDDISAQMGDPNEAMTATALNYLAGGSCTPFASSAGRVAGSEESRGLLAPGLRDRSVVQHEVPGAF